MIYLMADDDGLVNLQVEVVLAMHYLIDYINIGYSGIAFIRGMTKELSLMKKDGTQPPLK